MTPAQLQAFRLVQGIAPTYSHAIDPKEWCIKEFLVAMTSRYHTDVSTYDSADGIENLVTEFELSMVTLYDHPHSSDESCSVAMLLVKGLPLVGWKRVGDRSDYSDGLVVFNDAHGRALAMRVWQLMHNTDAVGEDALDVLAWAFGDNQYVHHVQDLREDAIAYVINSPHWMLGRGLNTRERAFYAINEDNTLSRIKHVVSTAMSPNPYGSNNYHRTTVELEDGTQRELETNTIVHTPLRVPT